MSNTPSDRGADCTALALCKRELVRVWGDGTIEDILAAREEIDLPEVDDTWRLLQLRHALVERARA